MTGPKELGKVVSRDLWILDGSRFGTHGGRKRDAGYFGLCRSTNSQFVRR